MTTERAELPVTNETRRHPSKGLGPAALHTAREHSRYVAEWRSSLSEIDPQNIRAVAHHLLNNPWRPSPSPPEVSIEEALIHFRRAVGVRGLPAAIAVRDALVNGEEPDPKQLHAFAKQLNCADTSPLTPRKVKEEAEELFRQVKSQRGLKLRIKEAYNNSRGNVPLTTVAASLRINVSDLFEFAEELEAHQYGSPNSRGLLHCYAAANEGQQPEFYLNHPKATGLRAGVRAAQLLAGTAEIATPASLSQNLRDRVGPQSLARTPLGNQQIGWQSHQVWQRIGACSEPGNTAVFSEVIMQENVTAENPSVKAAQHICRSCLVRPQCAEWAVAYKSRGEIAGVWGMLTPYEIGLALTTADAVVSCVRPGTSIKDIYEPYLDELFKTTRRTGTQPQEDSEEAGS